MTKEELDKLPFDLTREELLRCPECGEQGKLEFRNDDTAFLRCSNDHAFTQDRTTLYRAGMKELG